MTGSPTVSDVASFLAGLHGARVDGLELLLGGFWSAAYGYRVGERELVARFGPLRQGFEMDRAAMSLTRPGLPIPEVLDVGDAFGGAFAISARCHGRFLETVEPDEAAVAGPMLGGLLGALRSVPFEPDAPIAWEPSPRAFASTWRDWLLDAFVDDPHKPVHGWRRRLEADAQAAALFDACRRTVDELLDACPERRDLVHGDLLHANVLVREDASAVNAVFSWKCSVLGDFLFDAAWCTFWSAYHPGIAAADVWRRVTADAGLDPSAFVDAAARHHCYEVQIAATHLAWNAWNDDAEEQRRLVAHTAMVLERGPLTT